MRVTDVVEVGDGPRCPATVPLQLDGEPGGGEQCGREQGHAGEHAALSLSGRVIAVSGDPDRPAGQSALTPDQLAACRTLAQTWEDLAAALCDAPELPDIDDMEMPIDPDDPDLWEQDVADLMAYIARKTRRRS